MMPLVWFFWLLDWRRAWRYLWLCGSLFSPKVWSLLKYAFVLTSSGFMPIFSHVSNFLYDLCSEVRRIFCSLISILSFFYLFYVWFFCIGDETNSCFYCVAHDPLSCLGNSFSYSVLGGSEFSFWYFFIGDLNSFSLVEEDLVFCKGNHPFCFLEA